ncbi:MAG: DUF6784 domain-containing protein [Nitrososphaerota archaeon]|nr:hypothetical protein [Candidatus Bathyarchaeota archaeon]MDW8048580.1 DUF6784 domain-containing protein [Nitrososphaerota archaeon]
MSEERIHARVSPIEILVLILLAWVFFSVGYITRTFSPAKYWVVDGMFVPYIYVLLILGLIGKRGIRGRGVSKEFAVSLVFVLAILTGKFFFFAGSPDANFIDVIAGTYSSCIVAPIFPSGAADYVRQLLPAWLAPHYAEDVASYYRGGGGQNWSVLIGPIISWTLLLISVVLVTWPMLFLILGPYWHDTERIQFPMALPAVYLTNNTFPVSEHDNAEWLSIFNLASARNKAFWAAFLIGLVLNVPFIISQVAPQVPLGAVVGGGYGTYPINLGPYFSGMLPSAHLSGQIVVYLILLYAILPLDISASIAIVGMFFSLIYRPLVVSSGIVRGTDPGQVWPIPHLEFRVGSYIGLGLIAFWATRDRWIKAFKSLSRDFQVDGVSMRAGMLLMFAGVIMMLGILTAAGGNLFMQIIWFLLFTLINVGCAYIWANSIWLGGDCHGYMSWRLGHYIGSSIGVWSASAPQMNQALAVYSLSCSSMGHCTGAYQSNSPIAPPFMAIAYGYARGTNANIRKVFLYTIVPVIALVPFALVFNTYVNSHAGISNLGEYSGSISWLGTIRAVLDWGNRSLSYATGVMPFSQYWIATIIAAVIVIVVAALRSFLPWFFLHPVGFAIGFAGLGGWNFWLNAVVGIALRISLSKILGPKRTMEYLVPILAGLAIGLGALYLIVGIYVLCTSSIPNLLTLWK